MNVGIRAVVWTSVLALVIVVVFLLGIKASEPAEAAVQTQTRECVDIDDLGLSVTIENILRLQAGRECLNLSLPVVRVTTRVQVPGDTVTRLLPQPTQTVRVPGDTKTVYRDRPLPGKTKTVTAEPRPQRSAAPQPTSGPTSTTTNNPTATATVTKTVEPDSTSKTIEKPGKVKTVLKNVRIGLASIIGLMFILIVAMSAGYGLGFKDSESKESKFMKSLLRRKYKS